MIEREGGRERKSERERERVLVIEREGGRKKVRERDGER